MVRAVALRVKLEPDARQARNGVAVLGASLRLTSFGPGKSAAERDTAKPATIKFCGAYIDEVRKENNPDLEPFARVSGQLLLKGSPRVPSMTLEGEAIEHDEPPPEEGEPLPYQLVIAWSRDNFTNPPAPDSGLAVLRLPEAPEGARFFELGVELEIDGAAEATADVNDRLDVPLRTVTFFDTQVKDDKDFPLDEERFELELFDGSKLGGASDEDGRVQVNPIPRGRVVLRFVELEQGPQEVPGDDAQEG
jgi:hypothetical protein